MTIKTYAERNREHNRNYFARMTDEERKEYFRARYHKNKDKYNAQSREWAKNNREASQASAHQTQLKRKYPEVFAVSSITVKELRDWLIEKRETPCTYCGKPGTHIDHVVPLAKGGMHSWDNIVLACKTCNLSKRDLDKDEWLSHIRQIAIHCSLMN